VNWEQWHGTLPSGEVFRLDLREFAPTDWDGRLWLGLGLQDAGSGRKLALTVLDRQAVH
jgi:hypothetical protein